MRLGGLSRVKNALQDSAIGPLLAIMRASGLKVPWHLAWLERTQWASPARLRDMQNKWLRSLIGHAYAQSVFYRRRLEAAGLTPERVRTVDDVDALPPLTRDDVREHFSEIKANNAERFRPQAGSTSGTTGVRLEFLRDLDTMSIGTAVQWRFWRWRGARFHHRFAQIASLGRAQSGGDPVVQYRRGPRRLTVRLRSLDPGSLQAAAAQLVDFQPEILCCGSPTLLTYVARYLIRQQAVALRPKVVLAWGERVFPDQRQIAQEAFGVALTENYASWEYVVFAGECERGRFHLAPEMGYVEILKNGRRQPPGATGEIVVTNLWNRAFPFIRYAIGDVGSLDAEPCPCGRGLPTWRIIGGREKELLATPTGYLHPPSSFLGTPRWRNKIQGIRFYQERRNDVVVQVIKGPEFRDEDLPVLRDEIDRALEGRLVFSIEFCQTIEETAGGKYRFIVSKVPIEI